MNEETLIFGGKKFISSRRASKIFGYSIDYIGQLARAEKIESHMVGRTRFIGEASLIEYVHGNNTKVDVSEPALTSPINNIISPTRDNNLDLIFKSRVPEKDRKQVHAAYLMTIGLLFVAGAIFANSLPAGAGLDLLVGSLSDSRSYLALVDQGSNVVIAQKLNDVDNTVLPYFEKADNAVISFLKKVRGKFLVWFKKETLLTKETETVKETTTKVEVKEPAPTPSDTADIIPAGLSEEELTKVVREIMLREKNVFAPGGPYGGIVTIQSTGDPARDQQAIEQIKKTFSDEVSVSFDQSGRSGVIKPVFRNTTNTDPFIFVLVPVDQ